jgi:YbbR domain-containing protein
LISFIQRYIFHNFTLKALSLLLAAGLWLMISRDEEPAEEAVHAPIMLLHLPSNIEISSRDIPEAQIRVRGPERVIRNLQPSQIYAEIDLSGATPGDRTFDLTSSRVRHPRDVSVVQVVPSQLPLVFDTRLTRVVEIHPHVVGIPAGATVAVDPPTISISGPAQHVQHFDAATTDPIDASHAQGTTVFTTDVYVSDALVQVTQPTAIRVTVTVPSPAAPAH